VSTFALYVLLLKATATSFAGMGSLPQIRQDLVVTAHAITDEQLSQAVLVGRSTPGPVGAYVVAVGYFAGGVQGAIAGLLAVMTPAFAAVPLLVLMQRWLHVPRVRAAVDAVVMASAALLVVSVVRMASDGARQFAHLVGVR
jgi:chromate transporter